MLVSDLPRDTTHAHLAAAVEGWAATVEEARVALAADGRECRGFGFVTMVHPMYAAQLLAACRGVLRVAGRECPVSLSRHSKLDNSPWVCRDCRRINYSHRPRCHK